MWKGTSESDKKLEGLWMELGSITIDDDDCIIEPFYQWEPGTPKLHIWHWFDKEYSLGLAALLYGSNENKVYVLTYTPRAVDEKENMQDDSFGNMLIYNLTFYV